MAHRAPVLDPTIDELLQTYDRLGPFPIAEEDYVRLALDDPGIKWELHDGLLVEKPGMSVPHLDANSVLGHQLAQQLDFRELLVIVNDSRLRRGPRTFLIPDVSIVPREVIRRLRRVQPEGLAVFDDPMPFVAEGWSPSTGNYDINVKIPVYKQRGDLEIWRIHPYQRIVTIWRRTSDGQYDEMVVTSGKIRLHALPQVEVDIDALFEI